MERNDTAVMEDEDLGLVDESAQSTHGDMYSAVPANSPPIGIANWRRPKGSIANFPSAAVARNQFRDVSGKFIARSSLYLGLGIGAAKSD